MARAYNVVPADLPPLPCAKPEALPLVDAAFTRPGGPEAQRMKRELCAGCPIGAACLAWALTHREEGVWGGTGANTRTRHGAPPHRAYASTKRRRTGAA